MTVPIPRPISQLDDRDMQAVPDALLRAADNARRLAEQTGTPFVVRQPVVPDAAIDPLGTVSPPPVPTGST